MFTKEEQATLLNAISQDLSLLNKAKNYAFKLSEEDFDAENKKWFLLLQQAANDGYESIDNNTVKTYNPQLVVEIIETKNPKTDFLNMMKVYIDHSSSESFKAVSQQIIHNIKQVQLGNVENVDSTIEKIVNAALHYQKATGRWNSGSAIDVLTEDYNYEEDNGRIPTYLGEIDDVLNGGYYRGGLHVISAFPHNGKTTISIQFATLQAARGYKVLYLTLEQRRVDILENVLSVLAEEDTKNRSYWEVGKLKSLQDAGEKRKQARELLDKHIKGRLHIDDTPFADENELIDRIKIATEQENFDIVYIDNFQNAAIYSDQTVRFGKLADELLNISKATKTPIVCLSQLTSDGKGGEKTKYAAKLNENAVTNLKIYREKPAEKGDNEEEQAPDVPMIYVNIAKNRKGKGFLKEDLSFMFNGEKSVIGTLDLPKRTADEDFIQGIEEEVAKLENDPIYYKDSVLPF